MGEEEKTLEEMRITSQKDKVKNALLNIIALRAKAKNISQKEALRQIEKEMENNSNRKITS